MLNFRLGVDGDGVLGWQGKKIVHVAGSWRGMHLVDAEQAEALRFRVYHKCAGREDQLCVPFGRRSAVQTIEGFLDYLEALGKKYGDRRGFWNPPTEKSAAKTSTA